MIMTYELIYLLLQSAVTRRRTSMEAEDADGNTPRFIRHCKPLRSPNRRFSGADLGGTESELEGDGNNGSTREGGMTMQQFLTNPDAKTRHKSRKTQTF